MKVMLCINLNINHSTKFTYIFFFIISELERLIYSQKVYMYLLTNYKVFYKV